MWLAFFRHLQPGGASLGYGHAQAHTNRHPTTLHRNYDIKMQNMPESVLVFFVTPGGGHDDDTVKYKEIERSGGSLYQMKVVSSRKKPSTPRHIEEWKIVGVIVYTVKEAA